VTEFWISRDLILSFNLLFCDYSTFFMLSIILPIYMIYSFQIRDTSVFVKLRPAWEELRSYLTAKGRKRFEVYVCTMAERDYALEMWRLLDPEGNLISPQQLSERINCVKSGK